jgi:hypothetical protein
MACTPDSLELSRVLVACEPERMASITDLRYNGFRSCAVTAVTLNIRHPDPGQLGPFCRLDVEDHAPSAAGVYSWVVNDRVMYVGKAHELRQIVRGARMQRAYNDYTYIPPSKAQQVHSPRVRINGLLNRALSESAVVTWWWTETSSPTAAGALEKRLIAEWRPPWNRT